MALTFRLGDTIVAPITGTARAAIAVVRLSGGDAWAIGARLVDPWRDPPTPWRAWHARLVTGDDGLVLPFAEGASYTGEQSLEISLHGSPASVRALLEAARELGARLAEPGEFTYRAFMNGRIDLTQAEGVRDAIEAQSAAQRRLAARWRDGELRRRVAEAAEEIWRVRAALEASVDFAEEIGELDRRHARERVEAVRAALGELVATARRGRLVREGYTVVLAGRPNAGKSSLFNALLGRDRAIVTEIPGTTRDTLEEGLEVRGHWVRLVDTAGLRAVCDPVERLGIERARQALESADLVLYVFDAAAGWTEADSELRARLGDRPVLEVGTKCDLARPDRGLAVSAVTGEGLEDLVAAFPVDEAEAGELAIGPRHEGPLRLAYEALGRVTETFAADLPDDLAAVDLAEALQALGEVTGETVGADIVERVFRDFCIGK